MDDSITEILIIVALILANGFFALLEIALISSKKTRLQQQADLGDKKAKLTLKLTDEPGRFLSTIQVGITLVGVLTGAFGGATLAEPLADFFRDIGFQTEYNDNIAFGLVVIVITYLTIVLGELVPKQIGMSNPERIAVSLSGLTAMLLKIASPVVALLSGSASFVLKILRIKLKSEPTVSEEEVKFLLKQGTQSGVFEAVEQDMVFRVFRMSDKRASTIMNPRNEIEWIDLNDPADDIKKQLMESTHSRFPVANDDLDNIIGIARTKDFTMEGFNDPNQDLKKLIKSKLRKPVYVPETIPAFNVMESLKKHREHMALVIDEHGSIQGIVTLNDVLEAIVGDIPYEDEPEDEAPIIQRTENTWIVEGMIPIDEFFAHFNVQLSNDEEDSSYETLGGFIMTKLGKVPSPTDKFQAYDLQFEVLDMDGKRVDKVMITAPLLKQNQAEENKSVDKL